MTTTLKTIDDLVKDARKYYDTEFPADETPNICAIAPGRVNLIGEHVDYCDGFVMPMVQKLKFVYLFSQHIIIHALGNSNVHTSTWPSKRDRRYYYFVR
jgi:hypothetical protein